MGGRKPLQGSGQRLDLRKASSRLIYSALSYRAFSMRPLLQAFFLILKPEE